ncbi:MAG: hypothetical protein JW969_07295 [Spirochaetales bacterium]|nr:hypothetical protein [Spirochaetales bacterium]
MTNTTKSYPDLILEQFVLGELDAEKTRAIEKQMETDNMLKSRIEAIKKSNEAILSDYPSDVMAKQIINKWEFENRQTRKNRLTRKYVVRSLAVAAFVSCVLVAVFIGLPVREGVTFPEWGTDTTQAKGGTAIKVYRKNGDRQELLKSGYRVKKDDQFQIKYIAGEQKYGVILSIDGWGNVSLHYPSSTIIKPILDQKGEIPMSSAFELDNAPGFERFFFVTSKKEFAVKPLLTEAQKLASNSEQARTGSLQLPAEFKQISFILIKGGE